MYYYAELTIKAVRLLQFLYTKCDDDEGRWKSDLIEMNSSRRNQLCYTCNNMTTMVNW